MYIDILYAIHISHVIDILQALPYILPSKWCIRCFYRFSLTQIDSRMSSTHQPRIHIRGRVPPV